MDLLLRRARILDPASDFDQESDLSVRDGVIAAVGAGLDAPAGAREVDCSGLLLTPGLVDIHAHVREPGEEYKEDIASASAAAVAGGFTTVCTMPNTRPPNDRRAVTELILRRASEVALCRIQPIGAISMGLEGEALTEVGDLKDAGCVAISDDGRPVMNASIMRRALEYARGFGMPVIQHAEDLSLSGDGAMNEGAVATRAGLRGQPTQAEEAMVARDLTLVELTGARYHVAHVSSAGTIRLVREAKARGLSVTCEVTPHHLVLTDEACAGYDTCTKVSPPLRSRDDRMELRAALRDGTIDCVATDHAPHSSIEKDVEFDYAAFGMTGLETALGLVLKLVDDGELDLRRAVEALTSGPAAVLGLPSGTLREGAPADITVIDLNEKWQVEASAMRSRSQNSPFVGWQLGGRAVLTLVGGQVVFDPRKMVTE